MLEAQTPFMKKGKKLVLKRYFNIVKARDTKNFQGVKRRELSLKTRINWNPRNQKTFGTFTCCKSDVLFFYLGNLVVVNTHKVLKVTPKCNLRNT